MNRFLVGQRVQHKVTGEVGIVVGGDPPGWPKSDPPFCRVRFQHGPEWYEDWYAIQMLEPLPSEFEEALPRFREMIEGREKFLVEPAPFHNGKVAAMEKAIQEALDRGETVAIAKLNGEIEIRKGKQHG